jgi:hypothetical protein
MSMSFLVPAFLAGLLALAIPVLVHLRRRQPQDAVPFPSLMFLENVPQKSAQRRQIHRWPLLLLRCLAVTLLVFAFARPFVERDGGAAGLPGGGDREVVVLVDRSYSMAFGDRWERAVGLALEVVNGLSGGDRGTIVLFDTGAGSATESTTDRGVLRTALRTAEPGVRPTRYAPALRYGARLLASSSMPRHELVVISDFQRGGWDLDGGETSSLRLPAGTVMTPISVADGVLDRNVAIDGAEFERSLIAGRERVNVVARLTGSTAAAASVPVTLEIDGRPVETRQAHFDEGLSATVAFSPLTLPDTGTTRGILRIPADALAIDNTLHFVLSADQRLGVLIVEGPGAGPTGSFFLERALAIGSDPGFRTVLRRGADVRVADLAHVAVVVLNQAPLPGGEVGERIREFVEQGGGLVSILGTNLPGDWPGVLPSVPAPVERGASDGVTLGYVDTGHPVFEAFAGPRTGDFGSARIYRYRPLPSGSFPRVLARFGDGGAALAERPVGEGRVLVWTTTLDGGWNDLAVQPIFLPFVHQLAKYAAGYAPARSWMTVGDVLDSRRLAPPGEETLTVLSPSGDRIHLTPGEPLELNEVGFYQVVDSRGTGRLATIAVNVDATESDLSTFDPEEMRSALLAARDDELRPGGGVGLSLAERERQQSGWWYLIVAAFVLLAAETLFSNRRPGGGGGWSWKLGGAGRGRGDRHGSRVGEGAGSMGVNDSSRGL